MTKKILLTQNKIALIDDIDYKIISQFKWYAHHSHNNIWYAVRNGPPKKNGFQTRILMHRLIIFPPKCFQVDHINNDGLDNRRRNLRIVTPTENSHNAQLQINNTSGYRGVCYHNRDKIWMAYMTIAGKFTHLGRFTTARNAAKAYDEMVIKLRDKFAKTNLGR